MKLLKRASGEVKKSRRPTAESITKSVEAALKAEYMSDIFSYKVVEDVEGAVVLSYVERSDGLEKVQSRYLGKMALFTDRDDFTTEQIVLSYRAAWRDVRNPKGDNIFRRSGWDSSPTGTDVFSRQ